jgi:hypothetical protein
MTTLTLPADPLTAALEKQVESRLRERGLVVWLDKDGTYTEFVDELQRRHQKGQFFAPVVGYRGSYLDTLFALEPYQDGLDPEPLLLHLPGHNDQTIRETPLLEAYKAGVRYDRALDTLVREVAAGKAAPEATEQFLQQTELSLAAAQEWLAGQGGDKSGLAGHLQNLKPEWVTDSLVKRDRELLARLTCDAELSHLRDYLSRHSGFSADFEHFFHNGKLREATKSPTESAESIIRRAVRELSEAFLGWVLCVEYVHDLSRAPVLDILKPLRQLSPPLLKTCRKLCDHLRKRHSEVYRDAANQTESLLGDELEAGDADDLGKIDTFSREDSRLLEAAVQALGQEEWSTAFRWASSRLESPSVWLAHDQLRRQEWLLVKVAAQLGQAIVAQPDPLRKADSLAQAMEIYTGSGKGSRTDGAQAVDHAHRQFEQDQARLLTSKLPHFVSLQRAAARLRSLYREWVNRLNREFAKLCTSHGYLPEPHLQQRTLYEQEVHPRTQKEGPVAFFLVDALRYEMASELANSLTEKENAIHLKSRLAELPSITSVGMNVLAPVSQGGKLTLEGAFKGFRVGEYTVSANQQRLRAMGERSLDKQPKGRKTPVSYKLKDLLLTSQGQLKSKVKESPLIVVHSREIDESGEADVGLAAFDGWIGQLRSAVLHLHAAGVEEFVITADHGFLLLDDSAAPVTYASPTMDRRWVLTDAYVAEDDMNSVSLDALGYQGQTGHLMFLRDSGVFATKGQSARTFVHGGNSLQERVIPVLHISYAKRHQDLNLNQYRITADILPPVMGCSRLRVTLLKTEQSSGLLEFTKGEKITVAFRLQNQAGQVVIKDAPEAELFNQQLLLEEDKPVEVYFTVVGSGDSKAALEIYHPDGIKTVQPCRPAAFFPVDVKKGAPVPAATLQEESVSWYDNLPDGVRDVFLHIEKHGSITEVEATTKLGNPRKARRFAAEFEEHVKMLPFHVQVESAATGKRWIKVK